MDKFLIAWQELISNQEYYVRRDLAKTNSNESSKEEDLGSMFNEPRLNCKFKDPTTGEIRPMFTVDMSRGSAQLTCVICNVTAAGIKPLQSHINGKKHLNKLKEFEIIGNLSYFQSR